MDKEDTIERVINEHYSWFRPDSKEAGIKKIAKAIKQYYLGKLDKDKDTKGIGNNC